MANVVLATDGSVYSDAAAEWVAKRKLFKEDLCVHVVHCMPDVSAEVKSYISKGALEAWHTDESGRVMKSAIDILQKAGVPTVWQGLVGFAPERRIISSSPAVEFVKKSRPRPSKATDSKMPLAVWIAWPRGWVGQSSSAVAAAAPARAATATAAAAPNAVSFLRPIPAAVSQDRCSRRPLTGRGGRSTRGRASRRRSRSATRP